MFTGARRARATSFLFALLACLVSAGLLSGCASSQLDKLQQGERQGLPERAEVPAVPFYAQDEFYCGPAALAMTLAWSGLQVTQTDIVPMVYTPGRDGSLQGDVVTGARRYGRLVVPVKEMDDLLAELAAGNPVLVLQDLGPGWASQWQYAVAVGYDLDQSMIMLNSGLVERVPMPMAAFERTWARGNNWGLVITPPNRLAASADESEAIVAASGLDRNGHTEDAVLAYEAIVNRWPDSHIGWLALGNAHFALRDYTQAENAYRRAGDLEPDESGSRANATLSAAYQTHPRGASEAR